MSATQAAYGVEKLTGHGDNAVTAQDVSNYSGDAGQGEEGGTMKALCWMGKNSVEICDVPRPKILEPNDVILKVTGSTVCGSDLHLYHGGFALPFFVLYFYNSPPPHHTKSSYPQADEICQYPQAPSSN